MMNAAQAADMAINGNVVGRIGEDEFRLSACQELSVGGLVAGIPAQQAMATEQPKVSGLADRRSAVGNACKADVTKSCAGKGRLRRVSCMKEALGNLSDPCKDALAEAVGRK
jgi:hypothetical protein